MTEFADPPIWFFYESGIDATNELVVLTIVQRPIQPPSTVMMVPCR